MKLDRYLRARTVDECVQYLAEWGKEAALLAGGTDLIPKIKQGKLTVPAVIDLAFIPEFSMVAQDEKGVFLGSMLRLRALQNEERLAGPLAVLRLGAGHVSSMQVRNAATLGGNICNASPAADTVPALLLLDAVARIQGKRGAREAPMELFFTGPGETILQPDELLTGVSIPYTPPRTGAAYRKYAIRGDSDISVIGAGALVTLDAEGRIEMARIALASAGPTPLRMKREEQMLAGKLPDESLLMNVAGACAGSCLPVTDQRATKEYRKEMVRVWTADALKEAVDSARKASSG